MLPNSTFILGGAASGKSLWAETLLVNSGLTPVYLATGQALDAETKARIKIHRDRRDARWRTVEAPLDLSQPLADLAIGEGVLIDCATMWLTNHLMTGNDLAQMQSDLMIQLTTCPVPWIIVSNEVGQGIVPADAMSRQFREAQGRLNIALAAAADTAVQVIAGLPHVLKGSLP